MRHCTVMKRVLDDQLFCIRQYYLWIRLYPHVYINKWEEPNIRTSSSLQWRISFFLCIVSLYICLFAHVYVYTWHPIDICISSLAHHMRRTVFLCSVFCSIISMFMCSLSAWTCFFQLYLCLCVQCQYGHVLFNYMYVYVFSLSMDMFCSIICMFMCSVAVWTYLVWSYICFCVNMYVFSFCIFSACWIFFSSWLVKEIQ